MAATASKPGKASYRITNWRDYNESLVRRGDVTFWFDEDVIDGWEHDNVSAKVGRPFTYSDAAIQCLLALRELFRLPYRQTEGLGRSLAKLLEADVAIPDFTSLAKRAAKLGVALDVREAQGPIDVVVDSSGLKVYGEGEWKVRQHGAAGRRTWRKLHLSVNPATREIVGEALTENSGHDAHQVEPLLDQVDAEIQAFYGDGAYDVHDVRRTLRKRNIGEIIPPRRGAKIQQHGNSRADPLDRDECLRQIRRDGRQAWKESIGYHRRSLGENAFYRLKTAFGDRLKNRRLPSQRTEARLRCKLLNHFTHLGMPQFEWS